MTVWNCIVEPHIADCWRLTNGVFLLQLPAKVMEQSGMQGAVADLIVGKVICVKRTGLGLVPNMNGRKQVESLSGVR